MNVLTVYSEILEAYADKVGIAPVMPVSFTDPLIATTSPVVVESRPLYTRIPEREGRRVFVKPVVLESSVVEEVRSRILSRRRSRFTKEGVLVIPSEKLTGN